MSGQTWYAKGPQSPWSLFGFTRKHKSNDEPVSPVILEGIPTPYTDAGTDDPRFRSIRPEVRIRNVLKDRFSQGVRRLTLLSRRPSYPTTKLEVFVEVRRETTYDSERGAVRLPRPLGHGWRGSRDVIGRVHSSPHRCKRIRPPIA